MAAPVANAKFKLMGARGQVYTQQSFAGRPLVLYFMAFDCPICKKIDPYINEMHERGKGRYTILGVVFHSSADKLPQEEKKHRIRFPLALATKKIQRSFGITGTPTFWLLDNRRRRKEFFLGERGAYLLGAVLGKQGARPITGLFELTANPKAFIGKELTVAGFMRVIKGRDQRLPRYILTNGRQQLAVAPWLPAVTEAGGLFSKSRPGMDSLAGKPVMIGGRLVLKDGKPWLQTRRGEIIARGSAILER